MMTTIMIICALAAMAAFAIWEAFYDAKLLDYFAADGIDEREDKMIHLYQAVPRAVAAGGWALAIGVDFAHSLFALIMLCAWYWILFDILVNKIALGKPALYIGNTHWVDRYIGQTMRSGWIFLGIKLSILIMFGLFTFTYS